MDASARKTPEQTRGSSEPTQSALGELMKNLNQGAKTALESLENIFESIKEFAPQLSSLLQGFLGKVDGEKPETAKAQPPKAPETPPPPSTPSSSPAPKLNPGKENKEMGRFDGVEIFGSSTAKLMAHSIGRQDTTTSDKLSKTQNGRRTKEIFKSMQDHADSLKGKMVCFQPGLNDIGQKRGEKIMKRGKIEYSGFHPDQILEYAEKAAQLCKESGARELVIMSGYPFDHKLRRDGTSSDQERYENGLELARCFQAYDWNSLSQRVGIPVRFVNFYEECAYSEGEITPKLKASGYQEGDLRQEYERKNVSGYKNKTPLAGNRKQEILPGQEGAWRNDMIHPSSDLAKEGLNWVV